MLQRLHSIDQLPWIVRGDFNKIVAHSEKERGVMRRQKLIDDFREVIDFCGFIDPGYKGDDFTWCDRHFSTQPIWERLDRFLINIDMRHMVGDIEVSHLDFLASDHRPIIADWCMNNMGECSFRRKKKIIRFEESLTLSDECRDIISKVWTESVGSDEIVFHNKIFACLVQLAKWKKTQIGGCIRGVISRKEKELIAITDNKIGNWREEMMKAERDLEKLLEEDEIYWKQRAREDWLHWGDRNTKWFHLRASQRRKTNRIEGLFNEQGDWISEHADLDNLALMYFNNLFSSDNPDQEDIQTILTSMSPKISYQQNIELTCEFTA